MTRTITHRSCAVCRPGVVLKALGHDQYRCPRCSRLYDFTEETGAPHNNPAIAAEMNESHRARYGQSAHGQRARAQSFSQIGGRR